MTSERVVVTGAGGYIGPHVVHALLEAGYEVAAVARSGADAIDPRAEVISADILAEDFSADAFGAATGLVHLAWKDGFRHNSDAHMLQVSAHYRFVNRCAAAGMSRIVALGTMHEVGYWEGAIDESTPTSPLSAYGIAKDALRRSLALSLDDAGLAWARCYYIYGDDRRSNSIFSKLLAAADRGDTTFPFTSGKNRYDFIEVSELGRQLAALFAAKDVVGVVNCSSGRPVSLGEQIEDFIRTHALPLELEYGAFPDRPYDSPGVWGDATRIQQVLAADA